MSVLSETVAGVDFAAFYRSERRSLVRFVMFVGCADPDAAEDIAQTAFARAFPVWARSGSRGRGCAGWHTTS